MGKAKRSKAAKQQRQQAAGVQQPAGSHQQQTASDRKQPAARQQVAGRPTKGARQAQRGQRLVWVAAGVLLLIAAGWGVQSLLTSRSVLASVESFPSEGITHIPVGQRATYQTIPPVSGPHYGTVARAGFHTERPALEQLVHNLEHGHVVIYYNSEQLDDRSMDHLRALANNYSGTWDAVLSVPWEDSQWPVILTAWRHRLRLAAYDERAVEAFVDRFRGRGPENPVR